MVWFIYLKKWKKERIVEINDTILNVISLLSSGRSIEGDYLLDLINHHYQPGSIIYSIISSSNNVQMATTSLRFSRWKNLEKFS